VRTLDEVVQKATEQRVRLILSSSELDRIARSEVDTMFHTPLLAITILIVVRERRAALATSDVATWALATLAQHCKDMGVKRAKLQWSVPLRRRCADALVFLENSSMIAIDTRGARTLTLAPLGRDFVASQARATNEAGVLVRKLQHAYRAAEQIGLELL
jgi:hypothetical protein